MSKIFEPYPYFITIITKKSTKTNIHVHYKENCNESEIIDGILIALLCKYQLKQSKSTISEPISWNIMEEMTELFHSNYYQTNIFKTQLNEQWIVDNLLLENRRSRIAFE